GLVAPGRPPGARVPREKLDEGTGGARLDHVVELVRLARVFALPRRQQVDLPPTRSQGAQAAAHTEQHRLGDVAEVEADPATVRSPVLADLVPDEHGLVGEA